MSIPIEKLIQEALGDMQNLSPERLQGLIQETFQVLAMIQEKMKSEDPKEREEAFIMAQGLKELLATQAEIVCKKAGIEPSELIAFSEDPSYFSEEEWEEFKGVKKDLHAFREQIAPNQPLKNLEKHKNKLKTRVS